MERHREPANRKATVDVADQQDSPKLAAAAAQAHGREELYPNMGASRPSTDIAPVAARPVFPLSLVSPRCGGRVGKLGKAGWGTEVEKLVEAA